MAQFSIDFTGEPTSGNTPLSVQFTSYMYGIFADQSTLFLPCNQVDDLEFASIRMRGITNSIPSRWVDNGGYPNRSLMFWPVPSDASKAAELWLWEPLQIYDLDAELDLPKGYERYYIYALAMELCDQFAKPPTKEIIDSLIEAEDAIKTINQTDFVGQQSDAALEISNGGAPYNYIDFISGANMLPRKRA